MIAHPARIAGIALTSLLVALTIGGTPSSAVEGANVTLPDLVIIVPTDAISIAPDPKTGDDLLRFTHVTSDIGTGPFEIDPTYDADTGISTFTQQIYDSPSPGVWNPDYSVPVAQTGVWDEPSDYNFPLNKFTLNSINADGSMGPAVATSPKRYFCITGDTLTSSEGVNVANTPNQTFIPQANCGDPTKPLGWSVGWGDEYDQTDSGQPIDLRGVPDGTYILHAVVDPQHVLTESNTSNDVTDTTIQISDNDTNVTVLSQTDPGTTPPTVSLTSPAANATVSGQVTLSASASAVAPAGVTSVQFLLDGEPLGNAVTAPPYNYQWTVGSTPLGNHVLSAQVTDSEGQMDTAPTVPIDVVANSSSGGGGAQTGTGTGTGTGQTGTTKSAVKIRTLRWRDGVLTLVVSNLPKRARFSAKLEFAHRRSRLLHAHGARLRVRTRRPKLVVVRVFIGTRQLGKAITATLGRAPAVRFMNPFAGETLSGTAPIVADASDDVAISSVQFLLDGRRIGRPVTKPPYVIHWRTIGVRRGRYRLTAVATDPSGNRTSATVVIGVQNPHPPMTCFVLQAHVVAHARGAATSPAVHTAAAGETLLAFVSADGPAGARRQSATVTGGGLRWKLVKRANASSGDSEIWAATARTILTNATVTSHLANPAFDQSLSVIAMEGVDGVGSAAGASGATGAGHVELTTKSAVSLVFAVGNDPDHALARALPLGWVPLDQWIDAGAGSTFSSQYTNQPTGRAGSKVAVKAAAPARGPWNLAAVEMTNDGD